MNDMENLRTFADQLWKYMVPKIDSKFASNVSYFRAKVVSNPGNNKLEVQRPMENGTLTLPCVRAMSNAQPDQQVVALVMGSMSNAIVVGDGNLNVPGGGGDVGIANFQAQPDGSLVITLINGNTLTATPHDPTKQDVLTFDDVPTQGSSNPVKSGGVYTALGGKQDTLTFDDTPTANSSNPVKSGGVYTALDNKVDKAAGKGLSTNDFTTTEKNKLSGIEAGAQVNQNAFSNVKVGSTTVAADGKTDTLELTAGSNVTLTADASNDKVTIAAKDTTYSSKVAASGGTAVSLVTTGEKYTWNNKVDKASGKGLSTNDYTNDEKTKLAGIATGAEVNQNAFANVKVGSTTVAADAKQDTLELVAGSNVTITPDATNDKVTIAATDTTYSSKAAASGGTAVSLVTTGEKYTWNNKVDKASGKGLSTNDYTNDEKTKLAGIATGAEVNQNAFANVKVGSTTVTADAKQDTLELVAGSNVTITPDATNDKVTIAATDTTYSSKTAASGGTAVSLVTTGEKYTWNNKQNALTFDDSPTSGSSNPVKSGGVHTALANKVDKASGKGLSTNDYTTTEKNKLAGIAASAEVNQNAFANVKVGSTTVTADAKQDTLELVAGSNVTITPDATNDKVTIAATDTTYSSKTAASGGTAVSLVTTGEKYTWNNKQNALTFDNSPVSGSSNPVKSSGIYSALAGKQAALTFDSTPTAGSNNPVKSDGIKTALDGKAAASHTHTTDAVTDLVTATKYGPTGMASFTGKDGLPLKSWLVNIEPKQAGSGDPSPTNVRAISGWTGGKIAHLGKNLLNFENYEVLENGVTFNVVTDQNGALLKIVANGTAASSGSYSQVSIRLPGNEAHHFAGKVLSGGAANFFIVIEENDGGHAVYARDNGNGATISSTIANANSVNVICRVPRGETVSNLEIVPMIRDANDDAAFEPCQGETIDITFPSEAGTVYGGTLDVLKGTLTVDRTVMTLNGSEEFYQAGNGIIYVATTADCPTSAERDLNASKTICSCLIGQGAWTSIPTLTNSCLVYKLAGWPNSRICLNVSGITTKEGMAAWCAQNTPTVSWLRETPITYQLTPELVATLAGQNNFWADCGDVTVEYGAFLAAAEGAAEGARIASDVHEADAVRHITAAERTAWNGKAAASHTHAAGDIASGTLAAARLPAATASTQGAVKLGASGGAAAYSHTHAAGDIASGVLPAANGGTGNSTGRVTVGQKEGEALGTNVTSEGNNTTASGNYAHAEGQATTASGTSSHSEGGLSTASGAAAHSEGASTTASGGAAHSEGAFTNATADYSHSEGNTTTASGECSHSEGKNTVARGAYSHAEGEGTIAAGGCQHVFGKYNASNTTSVEIVGWGTSSTRKNIRTLSTTGNEWIAGTLTQASDARLKDVQGEIPDLSSIRAVRFRWKNGDDKEHLGYLAQDVEEIAPYLVDVDSNGYKSLDYIALLTAKVEMLEMEIERLKAGS